MLIIGSIDALYSTNSGKPIPLSNSTLLRTGGTRTSINNRHHRNGGSCSGMTSSSSATSSSNSNNHLEKNREQKEKEDIRTLRLHQLENGKVYFL